MKLKQRPYNLLLLAGLLLIVASLLDTTGNSTIDIHLHDTYYIIAHTHLISLSGIILLFLWAIYLFTHKILYSKYFTWIHLIMTILPVTFLISALYSPNGSPPRFYDYTNSNSLVNNEKTEMKITIIIATLAIGQIIFIVHLIAGLIKRKGKSS